MASKALFPILLKNNMDDDSIYNRKYPISLFKSSLKITEALIATNSGACTASLTDETNSSTVKVSRSSITPKPRWRTLCKTSYYDNNHSSVDHFCKLETICCGLRRHGATNLVAQQGNTNHWDPVIRSLQHAIQPCCDAIISTPTSICLSS